MKQSVLAIALVVSLVVSFSCSCGHGTAGKRGLRNVIPTSVADILDNPQKYADREVTVKGVVMAPAGVFSLSAYQLCDRTGKITVYSPGAMTPMEGEVVRVTGRVHQVYRFRDHAFCYIKQTNKD